MSRHPGIVRTLVVLAGGAALATWAPFPARHVTTAQAQWPTWLNSPPRPVHYPELLVDAEWVRRRQSEPLLVILDARPRAAYEAGHLPGARWSPLTPGDGPGFPWSHLQGYSHVVCYGDSSNPQAGGELYYRLQQLFDIDIRVLNGGLEAWQRRGFPVEPGPIPKEPTYAVSHRVRHPSRVSAEWIADRLGQPGITVLDVRPGSGWETGHVPHSLPFDLNELMNDDGTLMDGPTMRSILATIGPRPREFIDLEDTIVVLGGGEPGVRVHPFLALRAAGVDTVFLTNVTMDRWRELGLPTTRIVHAAEAVRLVADAQRGRLRDAPAPGLILFDLRHEPDFASGHLPGAILLPPDRFATQLDSVVAARWPGVDKATIPFAVYCYGPDCIRSRNATTTAARHGFRNLLWLRDGPQGFRAAGGTLYPK